MRSREIGEEEKDGLDLEQLENDLIFLYVKPIEIYLSSESLLPLVSFLATISAQLSPEKKKIRPPKGKPKRSRPGSFDSQKSQDSPVEEKTESKKAADFLHNLASKHRKSPKEKVLGSNEYDNSMTVEEFHEFIKQIKQDKKSDPTQ